MLLSVDKGMEPPSDNNQEPKPWHCQISWVDGVQNIASLYEYVVNRSLVILGSSWVVVETFLFNILSSSLLHKRNDFRMGVTLISWDEIICDKDEAIDRRIRIACILNNSVRVLLNEGINKDLYRLFTSFLPIWCHLMQKRWGIHSHIESKSKPNIVAHLQSHFRNTILSLKSYTYDVDVGEWSHCLVKDWIWVIWLVNLESIVYFDQRLANSAWNKQSWEENNRHKYLFHYYIII